MSHMQGFWKTLKKPFTVLAPMADVTDAAFRRIIAKTGKPDVIWTEFVSADGLFLGGREALIKDLLFTEAERPIVAQFFTSHPEMMEKAAALARELGFDGIDINMGCPDKTIERQGAGAGLIKNPKLAQEIIQAAKRGAGDLPVSVKTRIGYNKEELDTWIPALLEVQPAALTLHARTRKEMSAVPARWEMVRRTVELRDKAGSETLILGNGDVMSVADAHAKALEYGADGVMLGRAIFGNPWLWSGREVSTIPVRERLAMLIHHTQTYEELLGGVKSFAIMKKHYKAYVNGWDGAKELRMRLMECGNAKEVASTIEEYLAIVG